MGYCVNEAQFINRRTVTENKIIQFLIQMNFALRQLLYFFPHLDNS